MESCEEPFWPREYLYQGIWNYSDSSVVFLKQIWGYMETESYEPNFWPRENTFSYEVNLGIRNLLNLIF